MLFLLALAAVDTDRVLLSGHIVWIVGLALTGVLGVAGWALVALGKKLNVAAEGTLKELLLGQLHDFATSVVTRLNATVKAEYQKAAADGKITQDEAKKLAELALLEVKMLFTQTGVARLQKVFGWGMAEVDARIRGEVETRVMALNASLPK